MKNIQNLTIDINKKPFQTITANVGEVASRFVRISIVDKSMPMDLTGVTAYLYAEKNDGKKVFNNVTIEDKTNGIILTELTSQILAVEGLVKLTLLLIKDNAKLCTKQFLLNVDKSIVDGNAIESTNEFGALTESLSKVNEWNGYFEETSGKIEEKYTERLNNINSQLLYNSIYVAESNGIDDSSQIQEAIDRATIEKCKVLLKPNQVYFVKSPILLKNNVILDLNGSTLLKINTNKNTKIVVNSSYSDLSNPNVNIGIMNGSLIGNGAEYGVSDQGSAIAIINACNVLIENIKTDNTNGDGIQWRRADNVRIRDVEIGSFGRNGISPTSGLNTVWDNVKIVGNPITGANPGKDIDAETNSATEKGTHIANNIQCRNITLVDFYNEDGAEFSQSWVFNNCKIGVGYPALKIASTHKTKANITVNPGCAFKGAGNQGSGIHIENVSGVIVNGCSIDCSSTTDGQGISIVGKVDDLQINNVYISGCKTDLQAYGTSRLTNSIIMNSNFKTVYLGGYGNKFSSCNINWLRLNGEDNANTFDVATNIDSIELNNNASLQNQVFGNVRGSKSRSFYTNNVLVKDGSSYVMTIPIPDATNSGRCFMLFAGYSYRGRIDHSASLLASVVIGSLSTNANIINQSGSKTIEITNITQTEIELTLTYQYAGNFSVTLLG